MRGSGALGKFLIVASFAALFAMILSVFTGPQAGDGLNKAQDNHLQNQVDALRLVIAWQALCSTIPQSEMIGDVGCADGSPDQAFVQKIIFEPEYVVKEVTRLITNLCSHIHEDEWPGICEELVMRLPPR